MSDERLSAVQALSHVMHDVQAVRKDDRNREQNYSFRGIDAVMNAVGPALREHRVVPVPVKTETQYRDVRTSRDKPARECTVTVTYRFYGPLGDYVEAEAPGESMDSGDKGTPKAMSVAYRTCLLQLLCIPTDEPDADSQTYERAPEPREDPLKPLKLEVWQTAQAAGIADPEALAVDYAKRMGGQILAEAGETELRQYLELLRRAPDEEAPKEADSDTA